MRDAGRGMRDVPREASRGTSRIPRPASRIPSSVQQSLRLRWRGLVVVAGGGLAGGQTRVDAGRVGVVARRGIRLADRALGFAHVALELLDALPERAGDLGDALGAEEQQNDDE